LQNNVSFVCFHVVEKEDRLRLEEALISLMNKSDDFYPGNDWLGKFSPVNKISQSGLWLTQGMDADPLTVAEFAMIKESVKFGEQFYPLIKKTNMKTKDVIKGKMVKHSTTNMPINEIRDYLDKLLQQKKLGIVNATPTACDAMTKKINYSYEILFAPPKGKSTKLTVKYYL
jgi:hypothetical protein